MITAYVLGGILIGYGIGYFMGHFAGHQQGTLEGLESHEKFLLKMLDLKKNNVSEDE